MIAPDALDWLELASFQLTRVDGFGETAPSVGDLGTWRANHAPTWRRPALSARLLRDQAAAKLDTEPWVTGSLRRAAVGTLVHDSGVWRLPDGWGRMTLARWRLPLGSLHAAALAAENRDSDPQPHRTHSRVDGALREILVHGAADIHVHVGAILPFDLLFGLLLQRLATEPRGLVAVREEFHDSAGVRFDPGPVLAVAAALANIVGHYCADDHGLSFADFVRTRTDSSSTASAILRASTWSYLRSSPSRNAAARFHDYHDYFDMRSPVVNLREHDDPLWAATLEESVWLRRCDDDEHLRGAVEEILRCKALFHHALSQGARTGLSEFLLCSNRLRPLRNLAAATKRDVVCFGLQYLGSGDGTIAVELRTSEQSSHIIDEVARDFAQSLHSQFLGYEDFQSRGAALDAAWPICFIRSADANISLDAYGGLTGTLSGQEQPRVEPSLDVRNLRRVRFGFQDIWALSQVVVHTLATIPGAVAAIPGFDVAGDEQAVPSWVFALAFRTINASLPTDCRSVTMSYRVHAGESYASPIEGLRRVNEALLLVTPREARPRVGHALALADPIWSLEALCKQPADEAFDDLVWVWHELQDAADCSTAGLVEHLERRLLAAGSELYELEGRHAATADDFHRAYLRRFDDVHLQRIGLVKRGLGKWPLLADAVDPERVEDLPDRLLVSYLTDVRLRSAVATPLVDETWLREAYDAVQPFVIARALERRAIIEACPTSNLVIGGVKGYAEHPLLDLIREGLDLTISTDDPGLFGTTLLDEYTAMWPALVRLERTGWKRREVLEAMRRRSVEVMGGRGSVDDAIAALRRHWRASGLISPTLGPPRRVD